jgi:hypothetical protein
MLANVPFVSNQDPCVHIHKLDTCIQAKTSQGGHVKTFTKFFL